MRKISLYLKSLECFIWRLGHYKNRKNRVKNYNKKVTNITLSDPSKKEIAIFIEEKDIDFFFKKNPNYLDGTELVCVASIDEENITKRFKRLSR